MRYFRRVRGPRRPISPPSVTPCRLAGDEFVVLLPQTDLDNARTVADRLQRRLGDLRTADGSPVRAGIGVAAGPDLDHR
ncbi:diguanylate cyclase domain-containing protein [Paractinoplanes aksuensis]|uniref:diguanylate cyclase domain-containing protein n=1 Tax=Paractinoplanes aksuensis TaxID=2939490 RepID=UPI0027E2C302|nr:diguanylate cyclase [Actinoplanes aksuensis]